jgi:NitT/TauT family transport system substrate-binding protein
MIAGALALAAALVATSGASAQKAPLRIGYWTSGYSLGFGAVLEEGKFLEKAGVKVEFRHLSDVSAPAQAVLTGSLDVAFAAPAAAAFNLGLQGAPVRIILSTQVLEGKIVVSGKSDVKSIAELKGKKIGMSRPGSSTYAVVTTLLKNNFGLDKTDYTVIPGNEAQLAQLLERGDIDAAALRSVTIAQIPKNAVRPLADIVSEWKKLTKKDAAPALAIALTSADVVAKRPKDLAAFVKATRAAVDFGAAHPDQVAKILSDVANLKEKSAKAYADVWKSIYIASLTDEDVSTLKEQNRIFVDAGASKGMAPEKIYVQGPFKAATGAK